MTELLIGFVVYVLASESFHFVLHRRQDEARTRLEDMLVAMSSKPEALALTIPMQSQGVAPKVVESEKTWREEG